VRQRNSMGAAGSVPFEGKEWVVAGGK